MDPKGVPWRLLGVIWGPLGDFLGSLDVLLAAVGSLGGPWGIPGGRPEASSLGTAPQGCLAPGSPSLLSAIAGG